jgi:hypothetical protein
VTAFLRSALRIGSLAELLTSHAHQSDAVAGVVTLGLGVIDVGVGRDYEAIPSIRCADTKVIFLAIPAWEIFSIEKANRVEHLAAHGETEPMDERYTGYHVIDRPLLARRIQ